MMRKCATSRNPAWSIFPCPTSIAPIFMILPHRCLNRAPYARDAFKRGISTHISSIFSSPLPPSFGGHSSSMDFLYLMAVNVGIVSALSPLSIGIIRKIKARVQNRVGASIFQPYRDLLKLFRKDEVVSEDASWIFLAAPYIVFGTTLAIASGLPILSPTFAFLPMGDVLVFAYLLAAGAFFLALAGVDVGGAFGGFGGSREMMIASLTEGGLILSLIAAAFLADSTNLSGIAIGIAQLQGIALLPLLIAAAAFAISLLAENARYPVDNPATHLELTMVHEAMILEYSGTRLALMEWAAANKLLIFTVLLVKDRKS